eukprot:TRINITY_DN34359_c0_g1_i1.p3 TRINITY_DN34359_c0_g1~~TRINITY_DN34359_c0_g1_i1.p3  ORF type:complete len:121 (+),score=14.64 TRINITY_DN34359_c0_g1_i1:130-492(+)
MPPKEAASSDVVSGWLQKVPDGLFRDPKKRWFAIKGKTLRYWENSEQEASGHEPIAEIVLTNESRVKEAGATGFGLKKVESPKGKDSYNFIASSSEDRARWIAAITRGLSIAGPFRRYDD